MQFFIATEGQVPFRRSSDENSVPLTWEYSQVKVKDIVGNFIAAKHIYIDM